jgi:hypothetical protein
MTSVKRLSLASFVFLSLCGPALAQAPDAAAAPPAAPVVTFGVVSFLEYNADLHEQDQVNGFDVTRGYFNVKAQLSDRVRAQFTTDVRPTTDASLNTTLGLHLEYAYLDAKVNDNASIIFGMHETPWLTFEESIDRYRVQGTMFAEREGLIPGPSDLGASVLVKGDMVDVHAGVYNGEGYGRAEMDKYKSLQGRVTVHPFSDADTNGSVRLTGFYSYGWYAKDRPRNVAIVMGSYENPNVAATVQYLSANDNPFVTTTIQRKGLSIFGEGRQGLTGWAALGRVDFFDPDASNDTDARRRYIFGGAHWSQVGRGRLGVVVTLEQLFSTVTALKLDSKLLVQTHVEF